MISIEKELAALSNNFTEPRVAVKCWTFDEKEAAVKIFNKYYNNIDVSEKDVNSTGKKCWVILGEDPTDNNDLDYLIESDMSSPGFNISSLKLSAIGDTTDIKTANSITVLKRRAANIAKQWNDLYDQISKLARKIDLVASHDLDLNIELRKIDGTDSNIDDDLDFIDNAEKSFDELKAEEDSSSDVDDSFGPSEYDGRAAMLKDDEPIEEELNTKAKDVQFISESAQAFTPSSTELYINESDIDDDF